MVKFGIRLFMLVFVLKEHIILLIVVILFLSVRDKKYIIHIITNVNVVLV